jgi:hypothetical protein
MDTFGVHSEVGRLRKVMVHRPELSLRPVRARGHRALASQRTVPSMSSTPSPPKWRSVP